jgi:hypothetical protein
MRAAHRDRQIVDVEGGYDHPELSVVLAESR